MKIVCIGRNYADHARELNNPVPTKPVFFMKPDTALLHPHNPFFLPEFSNDIHYETELVIKISKHGKHIAEKFAYKYYEEITVGIDFTARDLQTECKDKGLPWEMAKAFDQSAPVGEFIPIEQFKGMDILFGLKINGEWRQHGNSKDMIFGFDRIIAYVSQFITLRKGDYIFTGTPAGVGKTMPNDEFELFIDDQKLLVFRAK
jgi:2-keto-4-pentenoate hydratase/2-oxohepta-3-ene-1,7-dioic acid hydratase in catechol pathway